jgi:hypothetical protein
VMSNRRRRLISPIEAAYSRRMRRVEQGCTSRSDDVVVVVSARTASDGCVSRMPCKACRDVKLPRQASREASQRYASARFEVKRTHGVPPLEIVI